MEADEFYEMAIDPKFPDEMAFDLRVEHPYPDRTFSAEGIETTVRHIGHFALARTMAQWKRTGMPPHHARLIVKIEWNDDSDLHEGALPFWTGVDTGGLMLADGSHRHPRSLDKRPNPG